MTEPDADSEDVEAFRQRARAWLESNFARRIGDMDPIQQLPRSEGIVRARALQRLLYDGGFAGIAFPREYGGLGLTAAHQRAFSEESLGFESPLHFNMSTLAIVAPTLLRFGTEEQKARHLPAMLRGDEMWVQMLSEPSGGSDLAAARTRADRDGDAFILNGSKVWTSGADLRDWGLCLARTDWELPKHRGLSMFLVKLDQPGVTVRPIKLANGESDFCEEFLDGVVVTADRIVGGVNNGWSVATAMMGHERNAFGGGTPFAGRITGRRRGVGGARRQADLIGIARQRGIVGDPITRSRVADAHVQSMVRKFLIARITRSIQLGSMSSAATSLLKLFTATAATAIPTAMLELAGPDGVVYESGSTDDRWANAYLVRQVSSIGGGTNEMQRNIISERLLGMPKEATADRDLPFSAVQTSRPAPHR
jgi:alkylation response protein AidB-like acyl-CoA dehydrogenase